MASVDKLLCEALDSRASCVGRVACSEDDGKSRLKVGAVTDSSKPSGATKSGTGSSISSKSKTLIQKSCSHSFQEAMTYKDLVWTRQEKVSERCFARLLLGYHTGCESPLLNVDPIPHVS